jgi:aspartyl/asparaginyl-tRNA synthetase
MDTLNKELIINTRHFSTVNNMLRYFFLKKGFLEVHTQNRLSIIAACDDITNIRTFEYNEKMYPLPQTSQMWLEYELLTNPIVNGYFSVCTSYGYKSNPISGRDALICPIFDFVMRGDMDALEELETDLLNYLGYNTCCVFAKENYIDLSNKYDTEYISHDEERKIYNDHGPVLFLKNFPEHTNPFWNICRNYNTKTVNKIEVILSGINTICSSEKSCNPNDMLKRFNTLSNGQYAQILYDKFGKARVDDEFNAFVKHRFIVRSGGGIDITRLIRSMIMEGLLE